MSGTRAESCAGDRALHRAALALRSAGLWICAWLSLVSCSWPPSIVVVVPSIPAGSATLSVLVSSAGKQATEMPRLDVAAFAGQAYRFGVHPPLGSVGVFSVAIAAYDKGGCLINATSGDIELTAADNDGFVYGRPERDLQLPLDAAPMEYAASCHNGVPTIRSFVQDEDDPTLVIITGWGFAPGITAQLDGVALTNVVRKDATRLEARLTMIASPSGLRGGSLLLTNPDGKTATLQVSVYGVSFAPRSKNSYPLDTALEPVAVAVADINKDDLPDVVVSGLRNTSAGFLGVYLNQGGGKYPAKPDVLELPNTGDDLAILDVNQDGHLDVAVISTMGGQLLVALNDGTGHYNPGQTQLVALPLGFVPITLTAGKFLGSDNVPDLVVASNAGPGVTSELLFYANTGNSLALVGAIDSGLIFVGNLLVADLNNDGNEDLTFSYTSPGAQPTPFMGFIRSLICDGTGPVLKLADRPIAAGLLHQVAALDMDGDARLDLMASGVYGTSQQPNSLLTTFINQGGASYPAFGTNYGTTLQPYALAVGDFNHDGRSDVAVTHTYDEAQARLSIVLNLGGQPSFAGMTSQPSFGVGYGDTYNAVGDLNKDGKIDVVVVSRGVTKLKQPAVVQVFLNTSP